MDRWIGKVALVTGASSGIGAAICKALAQAGMKVVGIARRVELIEALKDEIPSDGKGSLVALKCDLSKPDDIEKVFDFIETELGGVDLCINNAGIATSSKLLEGTPEEWTSMLSVNVVALCLCTKLAVASMKKRDVKDGLIINISSLAAHLVTTATAIHFYTATKHAVKFITEALRKEMREEGLKIRVTGISPGNTNTEFPKILFGEDDPRYKAIMANPIMEAEDVTNLVLHVVSSPPGIEIKDILFWPSHI